MKIGVSLYSFHGYSSADSLGIKGCIDKAKEFGCEGVDFVEFGNGLTHEEYLALAKEYGDYCKQVGIEAVCFCVGADFLNRDLDEEIERVKKLVDIAAALGAKCMRHDATPGYPASVKTGRSFDVVLPILTKAYRAVTEYAKTVGVKTCIENHGFFAQDPDRIEKLINAVGNDNFGALVDIGNFACADVDHAYAVGLTAPYAIHAHAKDFHKKPGTGVNPGEGWFNSRACNYLRGSIIGHGDVPVQQCIAALRRAGYDEYLMIEFEGMEDPLKGIRIGVDNLRRFINA
ncbi:MAG: sugar phosphate isomerase/epimerase [Clostridia bacterium]|jgi:sugar phosphate isomerase/epimerase|nr:sugar phosphate isomerase/epimerase [Clostridia bacterium]MBQ1254355.1 sugar phosphate isomerase/epimerase [Clostridia bacterium]